MKRIENVTPSPPLKSGVEAYARPSSRHIEMAAFVFLCEEILLFMDGTIMLSGILDNWPKFSE